MGCASSKTAPAAGQPASALGQASSLTPMLTAEANAVKEAEAMFVVADKPDAEAAEHRLTPEELAAATARYSTPQALRALLTHDAALGGVAVRLLSARWVLEYFQAHADARLEHRQHLEAAHGDAPFATGEALERMLAEVEEREYEEYGETKTGCVYMSKATDGEYRAVTQYGSPVEIAFPSIVAISHMWLDPEHPDPHARNLRERWLPAIEWYYSERVRQLTDGGYNKAKDADGCALSDAAVMAGADFGLFIDLSAMVQKDPATGERTAIEVGLFKHALGSLDVIYAHKALVRAPPPPCFAPLAPHVPCLRRPPAPRARRCRRACCRPPRRAAWSSTAGTRTAGGRASSAPRGS